MCEKRFLERSTVPRAKSRTSFFPAIHHATVSSRFQLVGFSFCWTHGTLASLVQGCVR